MSHLADAEGAFAEALAIGEEIDSDRHRSYALFGLGEVAAARGDLEAARRHHRAALAIRLASGENAAAAASRLALAVVALADDDAATAKELVEEIRAAAEEELTPDLVCWTDAVAARAALAAGDLDAARRLAGAATAAVTEDRSALVFVDITVARVEVAEGRATAAVERLASRLAECTREDLPSARIECLLELGTAEAAAGRPEEAETSLRRALDLATELDYELYTLYGHLSGASTTATRVGSRVRAGERIGWVGESWENGGWPPHVHFQIITDIGGWRGDFPGVARPSELEHFLALCPDPNLILRIPPDRLV